MKIARIAMTGLLVGVAAGAVAAFYSHSKWRAGGQKVPAPVKTVDLEAYSGLWYEIGRYENPFEVGYEGVTDHYTLGEDGDIKIQAVLHRDTADGPEKAIPSKAKIVPASGNAKWKISFFGPFYLGDYWIMDHADDYTWTIVGEPTGKLLWVMTRVPHPALETWAILQRRVSELGYSWAKCPQGCAIPRGRGRACHRGTIKVLGHVFMFCCAVEIITADETYISMSILYYHMEISMKRSLTHRATQVLNLLPFAQFLTRRPPSGKLLTAAAFVNSPIARRLPSGVLGFAKVAVAALALGSVIAGTRQRPGFEWRKRR